MASLHLVYHSCLEKTRDQSQCRFIDNLFLEQLLNICLSTPTPRIVTPLKEIRTQVSWGTTVFSQPLPFSALLAQDWLQMLIFMKELACGVLCGSPQLQMSWRHDYPAADGSEGAESCCHNWLLVSPQHSDGKTLGCWSDRRRVQECLKPNSAPSWLGNLAKLLHTPRYVSLSVQWDQDFPVQVLVRIEINQKEIIRKDPGNFSFPFYHLNDLLLWDAAFLILEGGRWGAVRYATLFV